MRRAPITVVVAALALAGCAASEPQQLAVGECLIVSQAGDDGDNVPVVPCDGPHEAEVYAVLQVPDSSTYDEDAVIAHVEEECVARFDDYVGEPYRTSRLDVYYTYPLEDGWRDGSREAACAVYAPDERTGRPLSFEGTLAADAS